MIPPATDRLACLNVAGGIIACLLRNQNVWISKPRYQILNTVEAWTSGNLLRGMSDMDVATKPTRTYLRRPRNRIPDGRAVEGNR